ncbi:MAG: PAS domain-containing protein [Rhodocyclaceae bacterium]|nr:MAG: PAS domain-containing protein [Rhodocyclaceae bacterium]
MRLLADLFSCSTAGVFAVDAEERVVFWNDSCQRLLGISPQEALGHVCYDVVRACSPSGLPFCKPGCCVARLADGGCAPPTFPLRFCVGQGKSVNLGVRTLLVPSPRRGQWTVVHMLCREESQDNCESLERSIRQQLQRTQERGATKNPLPSPAMAPLTARERGVLQLLAEGHPSSVISRQLCISQITVRNHIQNLIGKLGLHSQLEAVAYAHRHNLFSAGSTLSNPVS